MMPSVDHLLDRVPTKQYNCFDFVREVWMFWFNEDIADKLTGLQGAFKDRKPNLSGVKAFQRLFSPVSPCFVVMQRHCCVPHIGIYLDGEILHLREFGAIIEPVCVAKSYFSSIRYYR